VKPKSAAKDKEKVMKDSKQIVAVPELFDSRPLGYVQCVVAGATVFVAGQGGLNERLQLVSPDFAPQARQALQNVLHALRAAEVGPEAITEMTVYLTDMGNLRAFSAIKRDVLGETLATSTAVQVAALALPGMLVEVTVTAVRSDGGGQPELAGRPLH
jgi:enamine deaminase RidA (YjgF/YER057c/UK114 family)